MSEVLLKMAGATPGVESPRVSVRLVETALPEVKILEPKVFGDHRGFFLESYNERAFREIGIDEHFVQDNHSGSVQGVVRGLHYQIQQPQGKLIRALRGTVFDVAVDLRRSSPQFGRWTGTILSAENHRMLWIPAGFAHGFAVLSEMAEIAYKATDYYAPQYERTLQWDDPEIGIQWPLSGTPILSEKDRAGKPLREAEVYR